MTNADQENLVKIIDGVADFYQLIPLEDAWQVVHSLLPAADRTAFDESVQLDGHYYGVYEGNLCHESVL